MHLFALIVFWIVTLISVFGVSMFRFFTLWDWGKLLWTRFWDAAESFFLRLAKNGISKITNIKLLLTIYSFCGVTFLLLWFFLEYLSRGYTLAFMILTAIQVYVWCSWYAESFQSFKLYVDSVKALGIKGNYNEKA